MSSALAFSPGSTHSRLTSLHHDLPTGPGAIGQPPSQPLSPHSSTNDIHLYTPPSPKVSTNTTHNNASTTGEAHLSSYMKAMEALKVVDNGGGHGSPSVHSPGWQGVSRAGVIGQGLITPRRGDDIWSERGLASATPWTPQDRHQERYERHEPVSANGIPPIGSRSLFHNIEHPVPSPSYASGTNARSTQAGQGNDVVAEVQAHLSALQGLISGLTGGREDVEKLRKEVDMWRAAAERAEAEKAEVQAQLDQQVARTLTGRFVAVLIDGNRLNFHDTYLRAGYQGGQDAASAMMGMLEQILEVDLPIIIQVYIDKTELHNALVKAGIIQSAGILDAFWNGFLSFADHISVVDVGQGAGKTTDRIKFFTSLYSKNVQCDAIILGEGSETGSHIITPISYLTPTSSDTPNRIYIPDLFRPPIETPLPPVNRPTIPAPIQSFSAALQSHLTSPTPSTTTIPTTTTAAKLPQDPSRSPLSEASVPSLIAAKSSSDDSVEVIEWESVSKPPRKEKDKAGKGKAKGLKGGKAGKEGKAIDRDLALASVVGEKGMRLKVERGDKGDKADKAEKSGADEWVEAGGGRSHKVGKKWKGKGGGKTVSLVRALNPRPCHTFYLSPWGCRAKDDCGYSHDYDLNEDQTVELARLAKEIICPYIRSNKCYYSEDECVYGHRCPRGSACTFGDTCRFSVLPDAHDEDF